MTQLFCRESGHGRGESILFLHGGGVSSRMWTRELQAHAEWHCLAPDLPGHGESAHLRPFTLDSSVIELARLIRERSPRGRAHVVAFSVGVVVALALAAREPDLVGRLWLSGPTPRMGKSAVRVFNSLARPLLSLLGPGRRAKLVALSLGLNQAQMETFLADLDRLTLDLVGEINDVVAAQSTLPLPKRAALITVGAREIGATRQRARELMAALGDVQGYRVRDAGHAWSLDAPELFDDVLRSWMREEPLPTSLEPMTL